MHFQSPLRSPLASYENRLAQIREVSLNARNRAANRNENDMIASASIESNSRERPPFEEHQSDYYDPGYFDDDTTQEPAEYIRTLNEESPDVDTENARTPLKETLCPTDPAVSNAFDVHNSSKPKTFMAPLIRQMNISEQLRLELFTTIEKYCISRDAPDAIVTFVNSVTTAVTMNCNGDAIDPLKEFIIILSPRLTEGLLTSIYPVTKRDYDICRSDGHLFINDHET
ncbi:hypothetical protein BJV82DRAFT_403210 [Fennellomyces sp. T-0311]|nr:hypothetical protein BJV82DRAFT_403210 [Fennellomyces sp. T-0311]